MKERLEMKKMKNKLTVTIILIVCIIAGALAAGYILFRAEDVDRPVEEAVDLKPVSDVVVSIKPQNEQEKVYEEIVDSETGEKVIAEVQENEPIEEKPYEPPEKPKAKGSYTNPQSPPTYTNEQTVVEKNTSKTVPVEKEQAGVKKGKVYIEGFGYVDDEGGDSTAIKGTSDGDINKMVGVMD